MIYLQDEVLEKREKLQRQALEQVRIGDTQYESAQEGHLDVVQLLTRMAIPSCGCKMTNLLLGSACLFCAEGST